MTQNQTNCYIDRVPGMTDTQLMRVIKPIKPSSSVYDSESDPRTDLHMLVQFFLVHRVHGVTPYRL